ncbi:MAG: hypothetical protein J7513_07030 [Solirubrobacteraceae bacterium]|nr:hypothetical protein [Solirubrobacteraceae bacterium]
MSWVIGVPGLFALMGAWITGRSALTGTLPRRLPRRTVLAALGVPIGLQLGWFLWLWATN